MPTARVAYTKCKSCGAVYEVKGPEGLWRENHLECANCGTILPAPALIRNIGHSRTVRLGVLLLAITIICVLVAMLLGLFRHTKVDTKLSISGNNTQTNKMSVKLDEDDFFISETEVVALKAFEHYKSALVSGDLGLAANHLGTVKTALPSSSEQEYFWKRVKGVLGDISSFRLYCLCDVCSGPYNCTACSGDGQCRLCKGDGVCPTCKGVDSRRKTKCDACATAFCGRCNGSRLCGTCTGYGAVNCEKCRGIGNVRSETKTTCRSCGGVGSKDGLRRGDGSSIRIKCLPCGGSGRVATSELVRCGNCLGKGRVTCSSCNGDRRCVTCNGTGKGARACSKCRDVGFIDVFCDSCKGDSKCQACTGQKRCLSCLGTGASVCSKCNSTGLLNLGDYPVALRWLSISNGYWIVDDLVPKALVISKTGVNTIQNRKFVFSPDEIGFSIVVPHLGNDPIKSIFK